MRLERPRRWPLTLALLGVVLALLLGAVNVEMAAVGAPWNADVTRSVIVFGESDQAASPVKPRTIVCMLKLFLNACGAGEAERRSSPRAIAQRKGTSA
jgi:hypothetical protein